jgi:1-acyl-sn-glycerol-3-phosphate acyltransferase
MSKLLLVLRSIYIWITVLTIIVIYCSVSLVFSLFDRTGTIYLFLARGWCHLWLFFSGVKLNVIGKENVNPDATYVIASNHASYFDIPALLIGVPVRRARIVAKESLGKIPLFGWSMSMGDFILIKRGANREALKSLLKAVEKLREGKSIIMFADGTRSPDGQLQPFKRGTFIVAERAQTPVLPVTILGSYQIMPRNTVLIKRGNITLVIGKPISAEAKSVDELMRESFETVSKNFEAYSEKAVS